MKSFLLKKIYSLINEDVDGDVLFVTQSGNPPLRSKRGSPYVLTQPTMTIIVMMFMPSPVFIMSQVLIFPAWASNTMALGGVETGNMKAQLQVKVAGNIQYRGLCCNRNMSEHTGVGMKMRESKSGKLIQLIRCCVSYLQSCKLLRHLGTSCPVG